MGSLDFQGLVVRVTGKEVWVDTGTGVAPCLLRGRLRKRRGEFQIAAIESVLPRHSHLSRFTGGRSAEERVIVANVDTLFLVESARSPDASARFVDRVLVSAENGRVPVHICLNKMDLASENDEMSVFVRTYTTLGYPVTLTSATTGAGIQEVASLLKGGIYAFVGRSGVGKSSLLNRIAPELNLRVREVAEKTGRGRHTTTYSQLYPIKGGYVADTPGMQTFGYPGSDRRDLAACFPEFRSFEGGCRFSPCTHSHEPECAVKAAVAEGNIALTRHESYIDMLAEVELREKSRYS
jgi:ribosome biogenesis GTPase